MLYIEAWQDFSSHYDYYDFIIIVINQTAWCPTRPWAGKSFCTSYSMFPPLLFSFSSSPSLPLGSWPRLLWENVSHLWADQRSAPPSRLLRGDKTLTGLTEEHSSDPRAARQAGSGSRTWSFEPGPPSLRDSLWDRNNGADWEVLKHEESWWRD